MSEKIYALLLRLYPSHFRQEYGEDALQLLRDRARDEKGVLRKLWLWFDLAADLAVSVPLSYRDVQSEIAAAGMPSFQVLETRGPRMDALFLGGVLSLAVVAGFALLDRYVVTRRHLTVAV